MHAASPSVQAPRSPPVSVVHVHECTQNVDEGGHVGDAVHVAHSLKGHTASRREGGKEEGRLGRTQGEGTGEGAQGMETEDVVGVQVTMRDSGGGRARVWDWVARERSWHVSR